MKRKSTNNVPFPERGCTSYEKAVFYEDLVFNKNLDINQLKIVRQRLYKLETYFDLEAFLTKLFILESIKELIKG